MNKAHTNRLLQQFVFGGSGILSSKYQTEVTLGQKIAGLDGSIALLKASGVELSSLMRQRYFDDEKKEYGIREVSLQDWALHNGFGYTMAPEIDQESIDAAVSRWNAI